MGEPPPLSCEIELKGCERRLVGLLILMVVVQSAVLGLVFWYFTNHL